MKKVLVTGGAGFIGSNLVKGYLKEGYDIVIVDNLSTGKESNIPSGVTFYNSDIRSDEFINIVEKEKPDIINHHAAQIDIQKSIEDPGHDGDVNIIGTINVLEACKRFGTKISVIYPSSAAVYGNPQYLGIDEEHPVSPLSFYGISKHTPEHYILAYHKLHGINFSIFRYSNVYGIGQDPKGEGGVVSILVEKFLANSTFSVFGNGQQTRDFICVDDIVQANIKASNKPINNIVNIGTGKATSLLHLIEIIEEVTKSKIEVNYDAPRKGDIEHSYFNINKAKELLNWSPKVDLKEGIEKTFNYYKNAKH